jgi:CheY-like chemotaxis protein
VTRPRILLAEDDDELRWSLVAALKRAGFDVFAVANGCDLLDVLSIHLGLEPASPSKYAADGCDLGDVLGEGRGLDVQAIVTDVRMPGFDALHMLAGMNDLGCALPVVVISAFGDDEVRARARALGAVAFLPKPFELDALARTLREAIGQPRPSRAVHMAPSPTGGRKDVRAQE